MMPGVKYQYRPQGARVHQQRPKTTNRGPKTANWGPKPKLQFPHLQIYTLTTGRTAPNATK